MERRGLDMLRGFKNFLKRRGETVVLVGALNNCELVC